MISLLALWSDMCTGLSQSLVMSRKVVAQNYLRGWFTLDLVSSFPIDLVLFGKRSDLWRLPCLLKVYSHAHLCCRLPQALHVAVRSAF